jgi:hypothetical protein
MEISPNIQLQIQRCDDQDCFDSICEEYKLSNAQISILRKSWAGKSSTLQKSSIRPSTGKPNLYSRYLLHLEETMGLSTKNDINTNLTTTWNRLNLRSNKEHNTNYGLVVGRIQSGKTAHMLGLALKSLQGDEIGESYDTIVILSGTIEDLRKQTMERLEEIGYSDEEVSCVPKEADLTYDQNSIVQIKQHLRSPKKGKMIIVIKKNVDVLNRFNELLNSKDIIHGIKKRKVMIIDDECDYASMDGNNAEDSDDFPKPDEITETNKAIRTMLILLRKSASPTWYIGYTATPYANILMQENSSTVDSEFGLSLFPRNFIHSLPKPDGHLDNEQYFLMNNRNVINIDDPNRKREHSLQIFLYLHVISREIKLIRGISDYPHISLIHTDSETLEHKRVRKEMEKHIATVLKKSREHLFTTIKRLLNRYYPNLLSSQKFSVEQRIESYSDAAFDRMFTNCQIIELNRRKKQNRYDGEGNIIEDDEYHLPQEIRYQKPNLSAIVVGGTRVSRGLTLKGLTNTWFTRSSKIPNYDTMLQMSRWCGYRKINGIGYEDLVRIFTITTLSQGFRTIAGVERSLRNQLELFSHETDPVEERVWIQAHEGFRITGRMPSRLGESSMYGDIWLPRIWTHQPPIFGHDEGNAPSKELFNVFWKFYCFGMKKKHKKSPHHSGYQLNESRVKSSSILNFLKNYINLYPGSSNNDTKQKLQLIVNQIEKDPKLREWNVALRETSTKKKFSHKGSHFGLVDRVFNKFGHAKIIQSDNKSYVADIGAAVRKTPLLLIYLANQNYEIDGDKVFPDELVYPVPLLGIILPEDTLGAGGHLVQRFR